MTEPDTIGGRKPRASEPPKRHRDPIPGWTVEAMDGIGALFDPFAEGCGFMFGTDGVVHRVVQARNMWGSKPWHTRSGRMPDGAFSIGRGQFEEAERAARSDGLSLIGVIHTHLFEDAIPSAYDFAYLDKYRPGGVDCLWHIVSGDLVMYGHDEAGWPQIRARAIVNPTPLMRAAAGGWCCEPWDRHILPRPSWEHTLTINSQSVEDHARDVISVLRRRKSGDAQKCLALLNSLLS